MSSNSLFPPIVDSYMPAFNANGDCEIRFTLSKFNASSDFETVHISIINQKTGQNVVNLQDDITSSDNKGQRFRATGIILNVHPEIIDNQKQIYSVKIIKNDLKNGWEKGAKYKVQLRLCEQIKKDTLNADTVQYNWLKSNASHFSEWSTVCIIKAMGDLKYEIHLPHHGEENNAITSENLISVLNKQHTLYYPVLSVAGSFIQDENDKEEYIKSYQMRLYDKNDKVIEDTGEIYLNQFETNNNSFTYSFNTEFEDGEIYKLSFKFVTSNEYVNGFYQDNKRYVFTYIDQLKNYPPCRLITLENDTRQLLKNITSLESEEDEGRIGIKFYRAEDAPYSGNLCIKRSDSKSNFTKWIDVYIGNIINDYINNAPIFYDYTIESGVYYKYAVQEIDQDGFRTKMEVMNYPVIRNFNYSFLLGKNNQQLKLMFDNTMNSFRYQIMDSKVDTIGSKYGVITRNAATKYRTFPINGLISFWMDENKLFCDKTVIYKYEDIIELYEQYNTRNNITQYDYIYERDFREKVLEFLQDGEYKLFKSPTEGNIIVRLMDVNCTPNQSLDRMLYSFVSTAYEVDEYNMSNCLKYGFYSLGEPLTEFVTYETRLGQLQMDFSNTDNVFQKIKEKYDTTNQKIVNSFQIKVLKIHHIKITFDEKPLRVQESSGKIVLGNNFMLGDKIFTLHYPNRIFEFDDVLEYDPNNSATNLNLLGAALETNTENAQYSPTVHATIDFLYDVKIQLYLGKRVAYKDYFYGIGQVFKVCTPQENLYNEMYYRHFLDSNTNFSKVNSFNGIELQGNPGLAFGIQDREESSIETHIIGKTEVLRLYNIEDIYNLVFLGVQDQETGEIKSQKADVIVNYEYTLEEGGYLAETTVEEGGSIN